MFRYCIFYLTFHSFLSPCLLFQFKILNSLPFPFLRPEESQPPPQQSNQTNPKTKPQPKINPKLAVKKQQQLKKLEEIANKYKDKNEKEIKELKDVKRETKRDKSSIPVPKQKIVSKMVDTVHNKPNATNNESSESTNPKVKNSRYKQNTPNSITPRKDTPRKEVKKDPTDKNKKSKPKEKEMKKITKESSMSIDSLDEPIPESSKNRQSIGINTELLCVPCVIHGTTDMIPKKKPKTKATITKEELSEPEIELLYKNPIILSSCEMQIQGLSETTESVNISTSKNSFITASISDNYTFDGLDSTKDNTIKTDNKVELTGSITDFVDEKPNDYPTSAHLKTDEENILTDFFDENDEQNISNEMYDDDNTGLESESKSDNDIKCHFGSGNTYTKFTEDPADLEEFINITDKLLVNHAYNSNQQEIEADVNNLHTPRTNSIEAIEVNNDFDEVEVKQTDPTSSNTFEELKSYFNALLGNAGPKEVIKKTEELVDDTVTRKVENMEHITVYELNEEKTIHQEQLNKTEQDLEFKLPSINESNRSQGKIKNASKNINIYKSNRKYKLLAEENRRSRTFINESKKTEDSDTQSVSSEAPPVKLPRIENKKERLGYFVPIPKNKYLIFPFFTAN